MPHDFPGGQWLGHFQPRGYPPANAPVANASCDLSLAALPAAGINESKVLSDDGREAAVAGRGVHISNLPAFNQMLHSVAAELGMSMGVVEVAELFRTRGDAHIGYLETRNGKVKLGSYDGKPLVRRSRMGRDCLHWCAAPGVLDGIAQSFLGHQLQDRSLISQVQPQVQPQIQLSTAP